MLVRQIESDVYVTYTHTYTHIHIHVYTYVYICVYVHILCAHGYSKNAELVICTHPTTSTTAQNAGASNEIVKGAQVTAVEGMTQVVSSDFFVFSFFGFPSHRMPFSK